MSEISANSAVPEQRTGTVLVVDDEIAVVRLYARMLSGTHDVRTANGGAEALDQIDDEVDVILLDRRMPDLPGGEVLDRIRADGYDCAVAMVTAIQPEQDILAMDFDAYRVKPIGVDELHGLVDELLLRSEYSEEIRELMAASEKLATLKSTHDADQLQSLGEFSELKERYEEMLQATGDRFEEIAERVNPAIVYRDILET